MAGDSYKRVAFLSRHAAIWVGLAVIGVSVAVGQRQKPNRMVFFHMEGENQPSVFGMMRDDLLKLEGRGAGRIKAALERGPLKVWQYTLRNEGDGKWRFAPDHEIELTAADAPHVKFGAKLAIPPD
jgi:hypothetical protein